MLLGALRRRWGPQFQTNQVQLLAAFDDFRHLPSETIDGVIARFDIVRTRATSEAGLAASYPNLAHKPLRGTDSRGTSHHGTLSPQEAPVAV